MKKKNCKGVDNINAQINKSTTSTDNVAGQLKILKEMYDSGDLTQEEYTKAKKNCENCTRGKSEKVSRDFGSGYKFNFAELVCKTCCRKCCYAWRQKIKL